MANKIFMEYMEYDLNYSGWAVVEVPTRDVLQINWQEVFPNPILRPTFMGFPSHFRFFEAETENGTRQNVSKDHMIAEAIMTLDEYRKREAPRLEVLEKSKPGMFSAFCASFLDDGFSLKRAFKAALQAKTKPHPYIADVRAAIAEAEKTGTGLVHLWNAEDWSYAQPVYADVIILDRKLQQLYPAPKQGPAANVSPSS